LMPDLLPTATRAWLALIAEYCKAVEGKETRIRFASLERVVVECRPPFPRKSEPPIQSLTKGATIIGGVKMRPAANHFSWWRPLSAAIQTQPVRNAPVEGNRPPNSTAGCSRCELEQTSHRWFLSEISFDTVNSHPDPVGDLVFFTPPPAR